MSSKFGLIDDTDGPAERSDGKIDLSGFAPVTKRAPIDLAEMDAAAALHGFVSREAEGMSAVPRERRRRAVPAEPTRHLAVRMVVSDYLRFQGYADRHQLTYHEAIKKLLDAAGE